MNGIISVCWYSNKCHSIVLKKTPIFSHGHKVTPRMWCVSISGKSTMFYRAVRNYDIKQTGITIRQKFIAEFAWKNGLNLDKNYTYNVTKNILAIEILGV